MSILTLGEAMLLIHRPGLTWSQTAVSIAGAEANTAIGLARLGHSVTWASTLGDDPAGDLVLSTLRGEGVAVHAERRPENTGLLLRCGRTGAEPSVHYYRRDSAFAVAPPMPDPTHHELLFLTGITPALSPACRQAARALAASGIRLIFDVNMRAKLWTHADAVPELRWFCARADTVLATAAEVELLVGGVTAAELGPRLLTLGCRAAVVRHGRAGASYSTAAGTCWVPEVAAITVRDPIGAGDAFAAGFIAAERDGLEPAACLASAHRCGAAVCQAEGDWEGALRQRDLQLNSQEAAR